MFATEHPTEPAPWRVFLKKMALQLMQNHLMARSRIQTLPRDIRMFLRDHLGQGEEESLPALDRKKGRCKVCKNSSTTMRCTVCNNFVCKKHSTVIRKCNNCIQVVASDQRTDFLMLLLRLICWFNASVKWIRIILLKLPKRIWLKTDYFFK